MFHTTEQVLAAGVAALPTLFAFLGREYQTRTIYRFFSGRIAGAPPPWLFGLVWGVLYPLLSLAFYCVITDDVSRFSTWITVAMVQFVLLLAWPVVFTGATQFAAGLAIILAAWGTAVYLAVVALRAHFYLPGTAHILLAVWLAYAAYLNAAALRFQRTVADAERCRQELTDARDRQCIRNCP